MQTVLKSVLTSQNIIRYVSWQLANALHASAPPVPSRDLLPPLDVEGAFITLKRDGTLRACYGTFGQTQPLANALEVAARGTATRDTRFPPISPADLLGLSVDVSILFDYEPVPGPADERPELITVGTHGLVVRQEGHAGLLLPQVASEREWSSTMFLDQVCVKAGLAPTAWREESSQVFRFQGIVLPGGFQQDCLAEVV